jgi:hypothetical protein
MGVCVIATVNISFVGGRIYESRVENGRPGCLLFSKGGDLFLVWRVGCVNRCQIQQRLTFRVAMCRIIGDRTAVNIPVCLDSTIAAESWPSGRPELGG